MTNPKFYVNFRQMAIFTKMKDIFLRFLKFLSVLHKRGKEYITIMVVPHTEEKIKNFHFTNYFFISAIVILIGLFSINIFFLLHKSTINEGYTALRSRYQKMIKERSEMQRNIQILRKNLEHMKPQLSQIYHLTDPDGKEYYDIWGKGGSPLQDSASGSGQISSSKLDLKEMNKDLLVSKSVLERANRFLDRNRDIFRNLPTMWPVPKGGYVTSEYGWRENPVVRSKKEFHKGLDIAHYPGSPIVTTADGVVAFAGEKQGYGLSVHIRHEYGFSTVYAHCRNLKVHAGQKVRRGQTIAYVGDTGFTTGYHLHYEIRIGREAIDPWPFILNLK